MSTLLDGLAKIVADAVGETLFEAARLQRIGGRTPDGRGGWQVSRVGEDVRALVTDYSDIQRAAADIPAADRKILVQGFGLSSPPQPGDAVIIAGREWIISEVRRDPANALYTLQASVGGITTIGSDAVTASAAAELALTLRGQASVGILAGRAGLGPRIYVRGEPFTFANVQAATHSAFSLSLRGEAYRERRFLAAPVGLAFVVHAVAERAVRIQSDIRITVAAGARASISAPDDVVRAAADPIAEISVVAEPNLTAAFSGAAGVSLGVAAEARPERRPEAASRLQLALAGETAFEQRISGRPLIGIDVSGVASLERRILASPVIGLSAKAMAEITAATGGTTTFSAGQSGWDFASANGAGASVTLTGLTQGSLIVAFTQERNHSGEAAHAISNDDGQTFVDRGFYDQQPPGTGTDYRLQTKIWTAVYDGSGSMTVTADGMPSEQVFLAVAEIVPSQAYDWNLVGSSFAVTTQDTGSLSDLPDITVSYAGQDMCLVGIMTGRNNAGGANSQPDLGLASTAVLDVADSAHDAYVGVTPSGIDDTGGQVVLDPSAGAFTGADANEPTVVALVFDHEPYQAPAFNIADVFANGERGGYYTAADLALAPGDPVSAWVDRSANGFDLEPVSGASEPAFGQESDGTAYIQPDGTDDVLQRDLFSRITTPVLYVAVAMDPRFSRSGFGRMVSLGAYGTRDYNEDGSFVLHEWDSQVSGTYIGSRNSTAWLTAPMGGGNRYVHEYWMDGAGASWRTDGGAVNTASASRSDFTIDRFALFKEFDNASGYGSARIYGLVWLDRIPTAAERDGILGWLNTQAGIT